MPLVPKPFTAFMDRLSRNSKGIEGFQFSLLQNELLPSADSQVCLQQALQCEHLQVLGHVPQLVKGESPALGWKVDRTICSFIKCLPGFQVKNVSQNVQQMYNRTLSKPAGVLCSTSEEVKGKHLELPWYKNTSVSLSV